MKDTIVEFGKVILGVLLVVGIILGLFLSFSTGSSTKVDSKLDTASSLFESASLTNPYGQE